MLGRFAADTAAKSVVLDPSSRYGADNLQTHAVRGQDWQHLPQDREAQLQAAQNTNNMPPYRIVAQAAVQNPQRNLLGRIRSRYTFLPVGGSFQAPQSSA